MKNAISSLTRIYTVVISENVVGLLLLDMKLRLNHDYGAVKVGPSRPPAFLHLPDAAALLSSTVQRLCNTKSSS
jgi:hypothetical protein